MKLLRVEAPREGEGEEGECLTATICLASDHFSEPSNTFSMTLSRSFDQLPWGPLEHKISAWFNVPLSHPYCGLTWISAQQG